jgi:putative membrane protein
MVTVPLVFMTVIPALRQRWDPHRRMARWTWPIWLYVSVTGVLVYLMLYVWFPAPKG